MTLNGIALAIGFVMCGLCFVAGYLIGREDERNGGEE